MPLSSVLLKRLFFPLQITLFDVLPACARISGKTSPMRVGEHIDELVKKGSWKPSVRPYRTARRRMRRST